MSTELAHYGVKGMKWGRRRGGSDSGGSSGPSRKELRSMDRATRERQRTEAKKKLDDNDAEILKAREGRKESYAALKSAKQQYKNDKRQIGKVAAREILAKNREKPFKDLDKAMESTQKEQRDQMVAEVIGAVGKLAVSAVLASAARNR